MNNWPARALKGSIQVREVDFPSLKGNPLGDPHRRKVVVYLPPGYGIRKKKYPCVVALSGFLGTSLGFLNSDPLAFNLTEQADWLIEQGLHPFVLVCADGFTRYGGSQYLNSTATGRYEEMIAGDLFSWVHQEHQVLPRFGIMGRSSGGYGALALGMKFPEQFAAVACHSGDMHFEFCYKPEFPHAASALAQYGSVKQFVEALSQREKFSPQEIAALNAVAMSSCYSPNSSSPAGLDLPFDMHTLQIREAIWEKWLRHDPIHLVDERANQMKKLKLLFLDCGNRDEYFLHFGARLFSRKLAKLRVAHIYEEFPDGHRGTTYRCKVSLPLLVKGIR